MYRKTIGVQLGYEKINKGLRGENAFLLTKLDHVQAC